MTVLAVFRSRAQAHDAISLLRSTGVVTQAVATPAQAGCGCGVSAAFDVRFLPRVKQILSARRYSSFHGYFKNCSGVYLSC